jgi:hypothetical protein
LGIDAEALLTRLKSGSYTQLRPANNKLNGINGSKKWNTDGTLRGSASLDSLAGFGSDKSSTPTIRDEKEASLSQTTFTTTTYGNVFDDVDDFADFEVSDAELPRSSKLHALQSMEDLEITDLEFPCDYSADCNAPDACLTLPTLKVSNDLPTSATQAPGSKTNTKNDTINPVPDLNITARSRRPTAPRKVRPTLILPSAVHGTKLGSMKFDSATQSWRGNESALDDFENVRAPTLIPHTAHIPVPAGEMVFDPVSMKWIGNDSDACLFDHIEELATAVKGL